MLMKLLKHTFHTYGATVVFKIEAKGKTTLETNENAGALACPPATCPPCHYSKQKVRLTVIKAPPEGGLF